MIILYKVTSRSRPEILLNTLREYVRLCKDKGNVRWLISLDSDDELCNNTFFQERLKEVLKEFPYKTIKYGTSTDKINAINRDVNEYTEDLLRIGEKWDILLNISDDQLPVHEGYDNIIRATMPSDLDASLWFYDGHQPRINTQEIVGYNYYQRFKNIYNPSYKSFFCDNEATEIALRLGKMVKSDTCIIKHYHPTWMPDSHIKQDSLYSKNDQYWAHDEAIFKDRYYNKFWI